MAAAGDTKQQSSPWACRVLQLWIFGKHSLTFSVGETYPGCNTAGENSKVVLTIGFGAKAKHCDVWG